MRNERLIGTPHLTFSSFLTAKLTCPQKTAKILLCFLNSIQGFIGRTLKIRTFALQSGI